jgi:hypothetical protein
MLEDNLQAVVDGLADERRSDEEHLRTRFSRGDKLFLGRVLTPRHTCTTTDAPSSADSGRDSTVGMPRRVHTAAHRLYQARADARTPLECSDRIDLT